jgi:hypothetical protein
VVWVGIKMAHYLRKNTVEVRIKSNQSYLYSVDFDPILVEKLPNPTHFENTIQDNIENNSLIVYDFKMLISSIVIADMKQKSKQENIVFRFIPKNSKFIIGSDSAINRGEVLHF